MHSTPFVLLLVIAAHCGGSTAAARDVSADDTAVESGPAPGDGDTPADVVTFDAATSDTPAAVASDLVVQASVVCSTDARSDLSECLSRWTVDLLDRDAQPVSDATVSMGVVGGMPSMLTATGNVYSRAVAIGVASAYHVSAVRGADDTELTFASPDDSTAVLTPARPGRATAATLTWSPASEPMVQAYVTVQGPDAIDWNSEATAGTDDSGSVSIPGTVFTGSGTYTIALVRQIRSMGAGGTSRGLVQVARQFTVEVP